MDPCAYHAWYETPHGRWAGRRETDVTRAALAPRPGESLLDVGCGTGYFTQALGQHVEGLVVGVDIAEDMVAFAHSRDHAGAAYTVADARGLPFREGAFDMVVSIAVLCFVQEDAHATAEIVRVARRKVAIGLLNRRSWLWLRKGRGGGSGGYAGARWHTVGEALRLFDGQPVSEVRAETALQLPGSGRLARLAERLLPRTWPTGAFILVSAQIDRSG